MNRVRDSFCECGHIIDAHGTYSRTNRTQCAIPDCDCPRPRNENLRCAWQAALILVGLFLGLIALSACMGGAA